MKRFEIITEADARLLEIGSTVELAPRGHVTPLAADTLRDRRITVAYADSGALSSITRARASSVIRCTLRSSVVRTSMPRSRVGSSIGPSTD